MNAWQRFQAEECDADGRHLKFTEWRVVDVWRLRRSDGWHTAHKVEAPFCTWLTTVEESMHLADKYIPLGGDPPDGVNMRSKEDSLYTDLFELEESERVDPDLKEAQELYYSLGGMPSQSATPREAPWYWRRAAKMLRALREGAGAHRMPNAWLVVHAPDEVVKQIADIVRERDDLREKAKAKPAPMPRPRFTTTHTFAYLDVSPAFFREVRERLELVGYEHAFHEDHEGRPGIDMHGIALRAATDADYERDPAVYVEEAIEAEEELRELRKTSITRKHAAEIVMRVLEEYSDTQSVGMDYHSHKAMAEMTAEAMRSA